MKKINFLATSILAVFLLSGCQADSKPSGASTESSTGESTSVANQTIVEYEWNNHLYAVEAVSGATVEEKTNNETTEMNEIEKDKKMYWSGRPKVGTIQGDYYQNEVVFNEGYTAVVDVVATNDTIALVEFDEIGPGDYYDGEWAGMNKRLSGYAFFQASKGRTDKTLVTIVNTMTYLESQMLEENRLDGEFKTVKGSSNSANEGFIPAAKGLAKAIKEPSQETYYSVTKDFGKGLFGRLIVIFDKDSKKIKNFSYDEYFADQKEEIMDKELQPYYRQSKYFSKDYSKKSGENFRKQADDIKKSVLADSRIETVDSAVTFEKNYNELAKEMTELLARH